MAWRRLWNILWRAYIPVETDSGFRAMLELFVVLIGVGSTSGLVGAAVAVALGVLHGIGWGFAAFFLISLLLLLAETYRLDGRLERQKAAKPDVSFSKTAVFAQQIATSSAGGPLVTTAEKKFFGVVYVVNRARHKDADALSVGAHITYQSPALNEALEVYGRWGDDTAQPAELSPLSPLGQLRTIDLEANAVEHQLDLLVKSPNDADLYAYTNESQRADQMQPAEYNLGTEVVHITVRLTGKNMEYDPVFHFEAQSCGVSGSLTLTGVPPPQSKQ